MSSRQNSSSKKYKLPDGRWTKALVRKVVANENCLQCGSSLAPDDISKLDNGLVGCDSSCSDCGASGAAFRFHPSGKADIELNSTGTVPSNDSYELEANRDAENDDYVTEQPVHRRKKKKQAPVSQKRSDIPWGMVLGIGFGALSLVAIIGILIKLGVDTANEFADESRTKEAEEQQAAIAEDNRKQTDRLAKSFVGRFRIKVDYEYSFGKDRGISEEFVGLEPDLEISVKDGKWDVQFSDESWEGTNQELLASEISVPYSSTDQLLQAAQTVSHLKDSRLVLEFKNYKSEPLVRAVGFPEHVATVDRKMHFLGDNAQPFDIPNDATDVAHVISFLGATGQQNGAIPGSASGDIRQSTKWLKGDTTVLVKPFTESEMEAALRSSRVSGGTVYQHVHVKAPSTPGFSKLIVTVERTEVESQESEQLLVLKADDFVPHEKARFIGHKSAICSLDVAPNGLKVITSDVTGVTWLWAIDGSVAPQKLALPSLFSFPGIVRFLSDDRILVAGGVGLASRIEIFRLVDAGGLVKVERESVFAKLDLGESPSDVLLDSVRARRFLDLALNPSRTRLMYDVDGEPDDPDGGMRTSRMCIVRNLQPESELYRFPTRTRGRHWINDSHILDKFNVHDVDAKTMSELELSDAWQDWDRNEPLATEVRNAQTLAVKIGRAFYEETFLAVGNLTEAAPRKTLKFETETIYKGGFTGNGEFAFIVGIFSNVYFWDSESLEPVLTLKPEFERMKHPHSITLDSSYASMIPNDRSGKIGGWRDFLARSVTLTASCGDDIFLSTTPYGNVHIWSVPGG